VFFVLTVFLSKNLLVLAPNIRKILASEKVGAAQQIFCCVNVFDQDALSLLKALALEYSPHRLALGQAVLR
jgi:hypothetical protein